MNPKGSRRQREIEARERLILETASRMLLERGYLGLTMDLIAEATEYSKGTIYNHFANKEELLAAIASHTGRTRVEWFRRAAAFRGRPRERMVAIGTSIDLFVANHPEHFRAEQIVVAESMREKVSEARQQELVLHEHGCMEVVGGIVRDALACGDLVMPDGRHVPHLIFGLWTLSYGGHAVIAGKPQLDELGVGDPLDVLHMNQHALMDGHGWAPLTHEHDYAAVRRRVLEEVFPDEAERAGQLPTRDRRV